jgi:hypothetical protein
MHRRRCAETRARLWGGAKSCGSHAFRSNGARLACEDHEADEPRGGSVEPNRTLARQGDFERTANRERGRRPAAMPGRQLGYFRTTLWGGQRCHPGLQFCRFKGESGNPKGGQHSLEVREQRNRKITKQTYRPAKCSRRKESPQGLTEQRQGSKGVGSQPSRRVDGMEPEAAMPEGPRSELRKQSLFKQGRRNCGEGTPRNLKAI